MTLLRFPRTILLSTLLALSVSSVSAQSILVTTGEHADFTRLVLQSAQPIAWQLQARTEDRTAQTLRISEPDARIDISRAFQRIPRTRLADLVLIQQGLELQLNCDCPIEAWTERPGLVVLDIGNPQRADAPPPAPIVTLAGLAPRLRFTGSDLARNAGTTLARTWIADTEHPGISGQAASQEHRPSPVADAERQAIMEQLTAQVAGALSQGILDPSLERSQQAEMLLLGNETTDTAPQPNLRVMSVLERPDDTAALLPDDLPNSCAAAASLDFAIAPAPGDFNTALAAGMSNWIGEFDQPKQTATEDLITLYLQHGFGAEARALLENAVHPVPGRDLLLGFADTLEGRQSNSRLRLAEQHGCAGAAAMLAALAGAPLPRIKAHASDIASTYAQAPGVLRTGLGAALIRILVEADAVDAGRVVADTLRRTPHARNEDLHMAEALLDRARGETLQAGARLSHEADDDIGSVLLRLQIALETRAMVPESILLNAEAIASMHRSTPQGADLMDAVIRLRVNSGTPLEALDLIDRLEGWDGASTQGRERIAELGDIVWFGLALQASDPALLDGILNRSDWRNPSFSVETRTALAERLLGFGFTEAAEALLGTPHTQAERLLLARLHLEREEPDLALAVLADDQSDPAENLRAQALHARGESRASSQVFAGIGAFDAAARAAVLGRDWAMLEAARATDGTATQREIARALAGLTADAGATTIGTSDTNAEASPFAPGSIAAAPGENQPLTTENDVQEPQDGQASLPEAIGTATSETMGAPIEQPPQRSTRAERTAEPSVSAVPNAMERSATLLAESEELRAAFLPLLSGSDATEN